MVEVRIQGLNLVAISMLNAYLVELMTRVVVQDEEAWIAYFWVLWGSWEHHDGFWPLEYVGYSCS